MGPLLFLLYTSELFLILENKLIGYADDSTLMAVVPSVSLWNDLADPVFDGVGLVGFKTRANAFLLA